MPKRNVWSISGIAGSLILSLLVLGTSSCEKSCCELSDSDVEIARKQIVDTLDQIYRDGQNGDLVALAQSHIFDSNFTRFDHDGRRLSASQTQEEEEAFFSAEDNKFKYEVLEPRVNLLSRDIAVVTYFLNWTARYQGLDFDSHDRVTFVMKKQSEQWRIVHENFAFMEGYPKIDPVE